MIKFCNKMGRITFPTPKFTLPPPKGGIFGVDCNCCTNLTGNISTNLTRRALCRDGACPVRDNKNAVRFNTDRARPVPTNVRGYVNHFLNHKESNKSHKSQFRHFNTDGARPVPTNVVGICIRRNATIFIPIKQYVTYLLILLAILSLSCRKKFPHLNDPINNNNATDFNGIFENFWNGMNNNYVFWDIDPTNWDEVYRRYQPLFANLNMRNEQDVTKAYLYFQEMTSTLIDCHFSLTFESKFDLQMINPAWERKRKSPDVHPFIARNSYFASVFKNYCDLGSQVMGVENNFMAVSATIDRNILYLYISDFRLTEIFSGNKGNQVWYAVNNFFNLLKNLPDIKGVILDLRDNNGGYLLDLNLLMGQMIDKKLDVGYTRCKTGDGRLDYSPWIPAYITPAPGARKVTAPIVVLANMFSASMAEMTVIAVKSMPNGYFVGEQTWGAQGPLIDISAKFNSGSFECKPFIKEARMSSHALKDKNGKQYENIGLRPDIEVKHNQQALNAGKDVQLEKAIEVVLRR